MNTSILEARNLVRTYRVGDRQLTVIDGVSLTVLSGEFLVVTGPSGSGKTTLITLLSGLDEPSAGVVVLAGRQITGLAEEQLAPLRNETIGFVFQSYHLIPSLTARENVMFPAELRGDSGAGAKADALLGKAGLADRADNFPHQLSGGEKQRTAVCRALSLPLCITRSTRTPACCRKPARRSTSCSPRSVKGRSGRSAFAYASPCCTR